MYLVKEVANDLYWVGGDDRRLALFENVFPIPRGVSYNSYLLLDNKTVLFDTVDKAISGVFYENLAFLLKNRPLDIVVINHVEPDHCANLAELVLRHPNITIVGNKKTAEMLKQFFNFKAVNFNFDKQFYEVKEGDFLETGRHKFTFVMAPMVHWPEAMVTYDTVDKILFSADAFGTFGALSGHIFADELNFEAEWLPDARRYYTNIVGKYGNQVQALLAKAAGLEIKLVCPLHGPVWRKDFGWYLEKYQRWSAYVPEETAVLIAYGSIYGNTENAANILAALLAEKGIHNIRLFDVSKTHPSEIIAEAFRCSHLIFASATYNAGVFCNMETLLEHLRAHNIQNRTVALIENGSWAPQSGEFMRATLETMPKMTVLNPMLSINSSLKEEQRRDIEALADAIYDSMPCAPPAVHKVNETLIQNETFFKLSYGLFVLSAKDGKKDNACIINTVLQVTDAPKRVCIAVNKANYTHDMIMASKTFNVSILSTDAPFSVFQRFGFHSGRDTDKFTGLQIKRGMNGLFYDDVNANSFISGKVSQTIDCGTHTLFIADVTEAGILNAVPSMTYQYYFDHVKPKPPVTGEKKTGWICKVCGWIHEGDELPEDIVCPLCKHGASDFERLG